MLQNIKEYYGRKLSAVDGDIGQVKDFLFDDLTWTVRYLVANTGFWLSSRQVLLSPHVFGSDAFEKFEGDDGALRVNLTRQQIEDSPSINSHRPVSRQYEMEYYSYFGWPNYWDADLMLSGTDVTAVRMPPRAPELRRGHNPQDDPHLRSMNAVTGYDIIATDGPIGTVSGFTVDGYNWALREFMVETGHWYAGKSILVLTENIGRINYEDSTVFVNLTKEEIRLTPRNAIAHAGMPAG